MIPINMRNVLERLGVRKAVLAEHQPEYQPLPCLHSPEQGWVLTEWAPTAEDLVKLQAGGRLRMYTFTFGQPFQPVTLLAVGPDETLPLEPVS